MSAALVMLAAGVGAATILPVLFGARAEAGTETGRPGAPDANRVVVVELFTSQGCSSCPPADRLVSHLGREAALAGRIVPLAFHVDYWDRLGWRDPYSSPEWTQRQERYARTLRARSLYTPQVVVDGKSEMVGTSESEIRDAIRRSLAEPPLGRIELALGAIRDGSLPVTVEARLTDKRPQDLVLALFETGLETDVPRGENAGRHLADDYVVRHLASVARLTSETPRVEDTFDLPLEPGWQEGDLGVAAFLQDSKTLAVGGAAVVRSGS